MTSGTCTVCSPSGSAPSRVSGAGEPVVLDDIDRRIIRELQQDGRRTYGRIAEAAGLSLVPTRHRVARLIDTGVTQIAA